MKTKKFLSLTLALIMLASIFLSGCGQNNNDGDIWGRADAKEIDINSKISGRVVELLVEEGQHVAKGDVIARVDARDLIAQASNAEAGIAALEAQGMQANASTRLQAGTTAAALVQANAALDSAKANLHMADADYRRYAKLYEDGAVSKQMYDTYKTKYDVAQAAYVQAQQGVNAAQANLKVNEVNAANENAIAEKVNQAKASLAQVAVNLDETIIRAPFNGVITKKYIEAGSMLSTGTPVVAIQDPTDNWIDFKLPETELAKYDLEQEVRVEGRDGKTVLTGTIKDISNKAEFATRRATSERGDASDIISYNVKVQLAANTVRPGMRFKLLGDAAE